MINKSTRKQKKNISLIGLGYWGKNILRNLHELDVLHSACDLSADIIAERKKSFPDITYKTSLDGILEDKSVKAVAIATPAATHYEYVKKALLSGKDVFVEKPLALTVFEGEELVAIAEREGRILMVGHILQFHSAVKKLKEMISNGELGKVQYIYSNRLNIGKLRTEENILWSFAPHDISVILSLIGEEPTNVKAFGGAYLSPGIHDTTMTTLEFASGIKGHIFVSWLHPFKEQKLIVVGSKAMVVFDDVSKEKLFLYPHTIQWQAGKVPVAQKAECVTVPVGASEPLKEELKHFVECVQTRNIPLTDGREGLRVLKVLESAEGGVVQGQPERDFFVHPSAIVDEGASIDAGTKIWQFSHILRGTSIGSNCIIGQNVAIGPEVTIGHRCKVQNNVSLYKGVVLEDEVFCGPSCVFTNVYNPRAFIERKHEFLETRVKRGSTIGANATVVCGITIGRYAMIGAGAVIKSDVPDYAIMAGVPAKRIGWACKCGVTLQGSGRSYSCRACGNKYKVKGSTLEPVKETQ